MEMQHYRFENLSGDRIENVKVPHSQFVQPSFQFSEELIAALEATPEEKHMEVV